MPLHAGHVRGKSLLLSVVAAFLSLFHIAESVLQNFTNRPEVEMLVVYVTLVLATIIIVTLSLVKADVPHMDVLNQLPCICAGVLLLSLCFCCIMYSNVDDDYQRLIYLNDCNLPLTPCF